MSFSGGGSLLFVGAIYNHQCTAGTSTSVDPGANAACVSGAFTSAINFNGNPGSSTLIVGNIITDTLSTGGNSAVTMSLNKLAPYFTNRAGLLR
jgi:hypothetical protein